ncbi:MFS transporter [Pseudothauera nasutitermitis]|uniref:MFS transporter n=1 Tax=Pseudothauera nasutitermitis TaxID=2565930 RepID=A0A4S4B2E4_9RHOO|nr:MFS transporter [Pseudothauera nasutitermitis]THF65857.1 MFS transporter [Pseudothauera nasutitermitis]
MQITARGRGMAMAVVIAAYILSFFHRFAPAGIAQDLALAFHTSAASLGVLAATYFYVYTVMQVPTGILVDTLGPRRILVAGALVAAAGSLLFALAPDLHVALAGRTLTGLGVSVVFIAMLKLIAVWFDEGRFATLVGLAMLLGNLGSMLAGTPLAALTEITSWRGVFVGAALFSVVLAVGSWLFIADGRGDGDARPRFDRGVVLGGLAGVLKNPATWPAVWVNAGIAGSFFAFAGLWATPYLMQVHQLGRVEAASHLSLYFAGFALGCVTVGTLSDRLERRRPVLIAASLVYAALWLVWLSAVRMPVTLSYALFALMGAATSAFSLTWACAKEVNPPQLSGMSTSVVNMGGFLAGALLQPAVGLVMDLSWDGTLADGVRVYAVADFRFGIGLLTVVALSGALGSFLVRETGCRNIWRSTRPAG